jgi:hypothetical protein
MVNIQLNLLFFGSLVLAYLAVRLLIAMLIRRLRQIAYLLIVLIYGWGAWVLLRHGWRFDPMMQISQLLLIVVQFYWVEKELTDRP